MDLEPTRAEARLFVASLCGFWTAGAFLEADARAVLLVLAAFPLGITVYVVFARVLSRASGYPVGVLLGFRRRPRGHALRIASLWLAFVTPRWWRPVLRATGWPVPVVVAVLVLALAGTVLGGLART